MANYRPGSTFPTTKLTLNKRKYVVRFLSWSLSHQKDEFNECSSITALFSLALLFSAVDSSFRFSMKIMKTWNDKYLVPPSSIPLFHYVYCQSFC